MCIGIPMRIIETEQGTALCQTRDGNETKQVDMLLVGDLPKDSWVLVFLDAAREVLDEETAHQISDALTALDMAMQGNGEVDHLFADLVDREPQLPDFLQAQLPPKEGV
jgi:hydrogenase expression/formation protein HypC